MPRTLFSLALAMPPKRVFKPNIKLPKTVPDAASNPVPTPAPALAATVEAVSLIQAGPSQALPTHNAQVAAAAADPLLLEELESLLNDTIDIKPALAQLEPETTLPVAQPPSEPTPSISTKPLKAIETINDVAEIYSQKNQKKKRKQHAKDESTHHYSMAGMEKEVWLGKKLSDPVKTVEVSFFFWGVYDL